MRNVTAEEVQKSMVDNNISEVKHHDCCICGVWVKYIVVDGDLLFDATCKCLNRPDLNPSSWEEAANYLNMQSFPEVKKEIAQRFGITL